jgi:hypothetical protein
MTIFDVFGVFLLFGDLHAVLADCGVSICRFWCLEGYRAWEMAVLDRVSLEARTAMAKGGKQDGWAKDGWT